MITALASIEHALLNFIIIQKFYMGHLGVKGHKKCSKKSAVQTCYVVVAWLKEIRLAPTVGAVLTSRHQPILDPIFPTVHPQMPKLLNYHKINVSLPGTGGVSTFTPAFRNRHNQWSMHKQATSKPVFPPNV